MILRPKSGARWLGAALIYIALPVLAADGLTVISFGKADRAALDVAYLGPFTQATGIGVRSSAFRTVRPGDGSRGKDASWRTSSRKRMSHHTTQAEMPEPMGERAVVAGRTGQLSHPLLRRSI